MRRREFTAGVGASFQMIQRDACRQWTIGGVLVHLVREARFSGFFGSTVQATVLHQGAGT
jgi:hypothetical protein